jgi:hypothetical protein
MRGRSAAPVASAQRRTAAFEPRQAGAVGTGTKAAREEMAATRPLTPSGPGGWRTMTSRAGSTVFSMPVTFFAREAAAPCALSAASAGVGPRHASLCPARNAARDADHCRRQRSAKPLGPDARSRRYRELGEARECEGSNVHSKVAEAEQDVALSCLALRRRCLPAATSRSAAEGWTMALAASTARGAWGAVTLLLGPCESCAARTPRR